MSSATRCSSSTTRMFAPPGVGGRSWVIGSCTDGSSVEPIPRSTPRVLAGNANDLHVRPRSARYRYGALRTHRAPSFDGKSDREAWRTARLRTLRFESTVVQCEQL